MSINDFIGDEEIIADALTLYYTDHEPESCFVAVNNEKVIGYIIGSINIANAKKANDKIARTLLGKAFKKGVFLRWNSWVFFLRVLWSAVKGEFLAPDFSKNYPATLHINIDENFRGQHVGLQLIKYYLNYLKAHNISGVHFGTISERAKKFFMRCGFNLLLEAKRSYLSFYTTSPVKYYVFGKKITLP
jgi:GNAT superfamily N-acetyltransferase